MRILVIEDEAKTARFLRKGLVEAGFVVDVAADGLEGLYLAQEVEFDLVILDVMLPSLDGWQVLTRLRQAGRRAQGCDGTGTLLNGITAGVSPMTLSHHPMDHAQERARSTNAGGDLSARPLPPSFLNINALSVSSMSCRGSARVTCSG